MSLLILAVQNSIIQWLPLLMSKPQTGINVWSGLVFWPVNYWSLFFCSEICIWFSRPAFHHQIFLSCNRPGQSIVGPSHRCRLAGMWRFDTKDAQTSQRRAHFRPLFRAVFHSFAKRCLFTCLFICLLLIHAIDYRFIYYFPEYAATPYRFSFYVQYLT